MLGSPLQRRPLAIVLDLLAPGLLACAVFAAGLLILFSAATPSIIDQLQWLADTVPLFVVELSHFAASIIGLALLLLAAGLADRQRSAFRATLALLILSSGFAIVRGGNAVEALLFAGVAVIALSLGPSFYRQDRLSQIRFSPGFLAAVILSLTAIAYLGFFAYREVDYTDELWWTFVLYGDASRFLRALVGVSALVLLILLRHLTSRASVPPPIGGVAEIAQAARILAETSHEDPQANLALLGDKRFLFSSGEGPGFIQFAVRGHSWIAMGEPVAAPAERCLLLRQFQDAADHQGASSAFYAVSRAHLADFIDAGYVALKIGETALVDLPEFSLEGPRRAPLRHACNKARRDGLSFEIRPPGCVRQLREELDVISSAWLDRRQGAEKQFSLGRFDEDYLSHFPIALIRREGRIIAFANLWRGGRTRLSIDLMRYSADAPNGTMDYLFCELMLWARAEGYRVFDLGMAPLAGLEDRRIVPLASRLGAMVFSHGSRIYAFEGLKSYKQKFQPRWEGVYLAVRRHAEASGAMATIALLTSGGWRGLVG